MGGGEVTAVLEQVRHGVDVCPLPPERRNNAPRPRTGRIQRPLVPPHGGHECPACAGNCACALPGIRVRAAVSSGRPASPDVRSSARSMDRWVAGALDDG